MSDADRILGLAATTAGTDAEPVIPDDVYGTLILDALYAERQLQGIIAATNEDLTGRAGDRVKIASLPARTAQGPIAEGVALTDNATTLTVDAIVLDKYGDFDIVNREVFEDQTLFDESAFIRNMGRALAERIDQEVYDILEAATPGSSVALSTAGDLADLYRRIVELKAELEKAKVRPSHVIVGPDQAAQFLLDTDEGIKFRNIRAENGQLLQVAGLDVIVTPLANANTATLNEVQAIVIDRTRAVGEVWGRRPESVVDRQTLAEKDQVRLITWLRYGTDELDTTAIGHVVNPAA